MKISSCLVLTVLSLTFVSCKNNSSGGNVADVVVRNDKFVNQESSSTNDLQRFYSAQTSLQLSAVESELSNGKKLAIGFGIFFLKFMDLLLTLAQLTNITA